MTIDEAIERLGKLVRGAPSWSPEGTLNAIKLGFEALKAIKKQRYHPVSGTVLRLPGETEE